MLHLFHLANEHLFPGARREMHELRFREFVQKQEYNTQVYRGMEFDVFDTIASHYIIYFNEKGQVAACSRLSTTTVPYMINTLWQRRVSCMLPNSDDIWESSRFCVDSAIEDKKLRGRIVHSILIAHLEFGLDNGIKKYIGIMHEKVWKRVFVDIGWNIAPIGETFSMNNLPTYVAEFGVSEEILANLRRTTGIYDRVLQ